MHPFFVFLGSGKSRPKIDPGPTKRRATADRRKEVPSMALDTRSYLYIRLERECARYAHALSF